MQHAPIHAHDVAIGLDALGVPAAMLLAGLVGGLTHCVGMCGPFVLTQVAAGLDRGKGGGLPQRLRAAALVPYHLGRLTTYTALGAVAGGVVAQVTSLTGFRWVLGAFLGAAALYFAIKLVSALVQFAPAYPAGAHGWLAERLSTVITRNVARAGRLGPYGLGVALGFLPCGLVYGALAAAAGSGGVAAGALAMAAFALGTVPGLVSVGYFGAFIGRRWRRATRVAALPLLALNIAMLGAFAYKVLA